MRRGILFFCLVLFIHNLGVERDKRVERWESGLGCDKLRNEILRKNGDPGIVFVLSKLL